MAKKAKKAAKRGARKAAKPRKVAAKKAVSKSREKQVTTRFKTSAPKTRTALTKPRPDRAPRSASRVKGSDPSPALAAAAAEAIGHPPINAPKPAKVKTPKAPKEPKGESKAAKLEAMLRKAPVTLAEVAEQMEWLPHTTRAAISRIGFEVTTEKKDKVTTYHIAKDAAAKPKADAKSA